MVLMSSPMNFFRMVVLPALSRPLGATVKERMNSNCYPASRIQVRPTNLLTRPRSSTTVLEYSTPIILTMVNILLMYMTSLVARPSLHAQKKNQLLFLCVRGRPGYEANILHCTCYRNSSTYTYVPMTHRVLCLESSRYFLHFISTLVDSNEAKLIALLHYQHAMVPVSVFIQQQ